MSDHFPACAECGHGAWSHGTQAGSPREGETCRATVVPHQDDDATDECPCVGYRHPDRDHAAADQAHRDDLARDAALLWSAVPSWGRSRSALLESNPALAAALDRLAAAYGTGEQT